MTAEQEIFLRKLGKPPEGWSDWALTDDGWVSELGDHLAFVVPSEEDGYVQIGMRGRRNKVLYEAWRTYPVNWYFCYAFSSVATVLSFVLPAFQAWEMSA